MKLSKLLSLFVIVVCLSAAAFAQSASDPASKEDVEGFMKAMRVDEQMRSITTMMRDQTKQMLEVQIRKTKPTLSLDELDAEVAKGMQPVEKVLNSTFLKEIIDDMVPLYQHHFTHDEIVQLTAFYSTPVGQKVLNEMPALMKEYMQTEQPRLEKMMDELLADAKAASLEAQDKAAREEADKTKK
jgi:hypothetical protein